MKVQELFNLLKEANFSFTKASFPEEKPWHDEQKESMDKLIACGLAEKIGQNKYSLTTDGRKAGVIGLEKWAKSMTDISKREFVYNCFGFYDSWYNLPRLKMMLERTTKSTISKEMWFIIKAVIVALILYLIKVIFKIEL